MRKLLLTSLIICLSFGLYAQNGAVEGKIMQADSIASLSSVSIYLQKVSTTKLVKGTASNGNGKYSIKGVAVGKYYLVASAIGYESIKKELEIKKNETLELNFLMLESISTLPEIVLLTKGSAGVRAIAGSVHYISPQEIAKFGYTDINRTLRSVAGVNIQEEEGFGLRVNIGLRGTGVERSSKITVMEDGVLMAPAPYAAPAAYYFPTVGRMQGIEILKGSSQIKYGPYTTGGAINLISTQIPNEFSGRINLLGSSFGGKNLHAYVGDSQKNFAYLVETFQYGSNGFKKLAQGTTGFDKKDYMLKLRVNTDKKANIYQSLSVKIGKTTENSQQTYLGLTENDFEKSPYNLYAASQKDEMNAEQSQFSLTHFIELSDKLSITTTAYRTEFARNWYKLERVKDDTGTKIKIGKLLDNPMEFENAYELIKGQTSLIDDALFVKANNRTYYAKGVQTLLNYDFETGENTTHSLDFGFRYHQDQVDRFQWFDEYTMEDGVMQLTKAGVHGTESNRVETANALASYVQYKVKYGKITTTAGLRYENIKIKREDYGKNDIERLGTNMKERENKVDVFIPGIGLDYQFDKYTNIFLGIHKGFSPPGSKEGTLPEESINYELGLRYNKNSLSLQVVTFFNNYTNLLGSDLAASGGVGTGDLFNGGEVKTKGLELELSYDLLSGKNQKNLSLPISLAYTYTQATFQNDFDSSFEGWGKVANGDDFPYLANNQLSVNIGLEHPKFNINLSSKFMDKMRTAPGQGNIPNNQMIDSYFLLDASTSYILTRNTTLFLSINNLGDKVYVVARRPAGLRSGMPRAFRIGLKANF